MPYVQVLVTGAATWTAWNTSNATTCNTTGIWCDWNQTTAATTNAATTINVWQNWAQTGSYTIVRQAPYVAPVETAEQKAIREEQQKRYREEQAERERQRKLAAEKAEKLLKDWLDEQQLKEFEKERQFHVISAEGKRFRLKFGTHGNVEELDERGKAVARYCIQPDAVPTGDAVLAQKLMLETDEKAFRKIANRTALTG